MDKCTCIPGFYFCEHCQNELRNMLAPKTASATEVAAPHFTADQHEKYIDQRSEGVDGE